MLAEEFAIDTCPPAPEGIPEHLWAAEHAREVKSLDDGIHRFMKQLEASKAYGAESQGGPSSTLLGRIVQPVADRLEAWVKEAKSGKPGPRHEVLPLLLSLPSLTVASYLACKAVVDELTIESRTANRLAFSIAERLETEVRIQAMIHHEDKAVAKASKSLLKRGQRQSLSYPFMRAMLIKAANKGLCRHLPKWSLRDKACIGGCLIEFIISETGIIRFREEYKNKTTSQKMVEPSPETEAWLASRTEQTRESRPYFAPLVCPPRPWVDPYEGGYWHLPTALVRKGRPAYLEELKNDPATQNIYKAVNALQATAWEINPVIFEVFNSLWVNQDYDPKFMVTGTDQKIPTYEPEGKTDVELKKIRQAISQVITKRKSDLGKRKALMMTRDTAKEFLDKTIWFSYNLDFRGRIYPVSTHLTPQGDDLQRGLLTFASSKLVETQDQIDCLAIHGANTWGNKVDKMGFKDRIKWVDDNLDLILQSAGDPLGYRKWMHADDPWQFLAFCMEWSTYLGEGLGTFRTKLPVAVDGTCSGLQHFSALLRDPVGASATNLQQGDKPSDIYGIVAEKTLDKVKELAAAGDTIAQSWIDFGIDRGCAKRPVMTLPYGSTAYAAREYIQDWLDEKMAGGKVNTFGEVSSFKASSYLTPILWSSIGETVLAARAAMDWLHTVAKLVAKSGNPVWWTTPSGFQVFQGYPNLKQRSVETTLQGKKVFVSYRDEVKGYDPSKAASGLAPNFVHSMDASALTLTVLGCLDEGIDSFGMIHDSFATHCTDMPAMNRILRKAFVDMYTNNDVMAQFEAAVREVLPSDVELPPRPAMGSFDLNQVLTSDYFFS